MAIRLVVEVLDYAPPMPGSDRLLLVALAERASMRTRECWPTDAELCRRTGLTLSGLEKTFARLARRGIEVRVLIRPGMTGRGAYTRTGHKKTYRLPEFAPRVVASEGEQSRPSGRPVGREVVALGGDPNRQYNRQGQTLPRKNTTSWGSRTARSRTEEIDEELARRLGADRDEYMKIRAMLARGGKGTHPRAIENTIRADRRK
jgi:hypothetical protein